MKLYFAYGSNLNLGQMQHRCPNARPVGKVAFYGHELVFRGVADIVKGDPSTRIEGGLWEITPECEEALDKYEGFPRLYSKIYLAGVMTYQMNAYGVSPPSIYYFNTILQGYHDFGLDTAYLYDAAGWSHFTQTEDDNYGYSYL
jgi:hypothetical protein